MRELGSMPIEEMAGAWVVDLRMTSLAGGCAALADCFDPCGAAAAAGTGRIQPADIGTTLVPAEC